MAFVQQSLWLSIYILFNFIEPAHARESTSRNFALLSLNRSLAYRLAYPLHRVLRTIHVIKVAIVLWTMSDVWSRMDDVIHLEYRFVSWIELGHRLFDCMDISLLNLIPQWFWHLSNVLDWWSNKLHQTNNLWQFYAILLCCHNNRIKQKTTFVPIQSVAA